MMLDVLPALGDSAVRVLIAAAKEGLLNVEKHAQAEQRRRHGRESQGNGVTFAITDDGVGDRQGRTRLHVATSATTVSGSTRSSMRSRASAARLQLTENPEGGTTFRVWVRS